jgi:hypothetical protein
VSTQYTAVRTTLTRTVLQTVLRNVSLAHERVVGAGRTHLVADAKLGGPGGR